MKIFTILYILFGLFCVFLLTCSRSPQHQPNDISTETRKGDYVIKVIDECEYIEFDNGFYHNRVYSLTHKGNCKFCIERNKK